MAGSRLYRLDTPISDRDEKGLFLPELHDCLLDRAPQTHSAKAEGYEYEAFSLQRFLTLAARAEDVALVMLHSDMVLEDSPIYEMLRRERKRFYTKGMTGACSFARSMAAKYSLRADRMATVMTVITAIESMQEKGVARLAQAWDDLPNLPHSRRFENPADRGIDKRIYEVAGKGLPATITPAYALDILYRTRDSYGERVNAARTMGLVDRKSLCHSFRVGYQLQHLYESGDFTFPLPETAFIKAVKTGQLNYVDDKLDEKLNGLISHVERLAETSLYPESVDRAWLDKVVLEAYDDHLGMSLST